MDILLNILVFSEFCNSMRGGGILENWKIVMRKEKRGPDNRSDGYRDEARNASKEESATAEERMVNGKLLMVNCKFLGKVKR